MPIRLAVADGHTLTRRGLRELAGQQPDMEFAAECTSAADAHGMVAGARPDVLIVDADLPGGNGLELARQLRARFGGLGIVLLAAQEHDDVLFQALEAGVAAFVARTAPVTEMLTAIRHAAVAPASFTASGLATALSRRRDRQERLTLSPREMEVLRLLRDGLSTPSIALAMYLSHSTVRTYLARLYEKLGAANRAQAIMAALHYGLIAYEQPRPDRAEASGAPCPTG